MWTDIVDLNAFYRSPMGGLARELVQKRLREIWPSVRGDVVVGLGYATPFLRDFEKEADRVLAVMPAYQGVTHWPRGEKSRVALSEETHLPFPDLSVDRLVLVHALENTERMRDTLRECWRVLNGVGKLVIVVPSRRGFWARSERTPFGHGKPFSSAQLQRLLRDCQFEPGDPSRAIYMPPIGKSSLGSWAQRRFARPMERIGPKLFPRFGGVILLEATKQIYAASSAKPVPRRRLVVVPGALGAARTILKRHKVGPDVPPETNI